jgi:hypothetical protein
MKEFSRSSWNYLEVVFHIPIERFFVGAVRQIHMGAIDICCYNLFLGLVR